MRASMVIMGAAWFVASYYGLGTFTSSFVGYYVVGVVTTFGFLMVEQKL